MANRVEIPIVVLSDSSPTSPVAGATAVVKNRASGTQATVYQDSGTTNNALTQPLSTDSTGKLTGWLPRGSYEVVITIPGKNPYVEYLDIAPGSDGGVDSDWIASSAITSSKIAENAVEARHIKENAVGSSEIAENAVGSSEVANSSINTTEIANLAITEPLIADSATTSRKIALTRGVISPIGEMTLTEANVGVGTEIAFLNWKIIPSVKSVLWIWGMIGVKAETGGGGNVEFWLRDETKILASTLYSIESATSFALPFCVAGEVSAGEQHVHVNGRASGTVNPRKIIGTRSQLFWALTAT